MLRDDQEDALQALRDAVRAGKRRIILQVSDRMGKDGAGIFVDRERQRAQQANPVHGANDRPR